MKHLLAILCVLSVASVPAADLQAHLAAAGWKDPIRHDLQRPRDPLIQWAKATGRTHTARNAAEVRALSGRLAPGDELVLTGADWKDAAFTFQAKGTNVAPVLVRGEDAVFAGDTSLSFHGEHLIVRGLVFKDQVITRHNHVMLRLGIDDDERAARRCILDGVKFLNCNTAKHELRMFHLTVRGADNTLYECEFRDYRVFGQCVAAGELPPPDYRLGLHILGCRFIDRPKIDDENGYEIIQIGGSGQMARPSGCRIEDCLFENCDGENEILTLKASDIVVRRNTFRGCQGVLSLRMGDRILVEENVFDGAGKPRTGGVGIMGADHVVIGNVFRDLRQPRNYFQWPVYMPCGSSEHTPDERRGYGRVKNILIAGNRFERCENLVAAGIYLRPEYPLTPLNVLVRDNTFTGTKEGTPFGFIVSGAEKEMHAKENRFEP